MGEECNHLRPEKKELSSGAAVFYLLFLSPSPRDLILLIIQVLCNQDLGLNPPMNER